MNNFEEMINKLNGAVKENKEVVKSYSDKANVYTGEDTVTGFDDSNFWRVNVARPVKAAKDELGGVRYSSEILRHVDEANTIAADLKSSIEGTNERVNNIWAEVKLFLEQAIQEGRLTPEEMSEKTDYTIGREQIATHSKVKNAYAICMEYWQENKEVDDEMRPLVEFMKRELKDANVRKDLGLVSDNWAYNRYAKLIDRDESVINQYNGLKTRKEAIKNNVKAQLNMFTLGIDGDKALLFAAMYHSVMTNNTVNYTRKLSKWGQDANFTSKEDVEQNYRFTRISSIFDLFSEGAIVFLYREGTNDYSRLESKTFNKCSITFDNGNFSNEQVKAAMENVVNGGGQLHLETIDGIPQLGSMKVKEECLVDTVNVKGKKRPLKVTDKMVVVKEEETEGDFLTSGVVTGAYDKYDMNVIAYTVYKDILKVWVDGVVGSFSPASVQSNEEVLSQLKERKETEEEMQEQARSFEAYFDMNDIYGTPAYMEEIPAPEMPEF